MKVLLTGASGFVGSHILKYLTQSHDVTCFGRTVPFGWHGSFVDGELEHIESKELNLAEFDVVVHSAARAHVMRDNEQSPLEVYRQVNTHATLNLAKLAAQQGVKRFVFISSIKVNGESTHNECFKANDIPAPVDDYGVSKAEAESLLLELGKTTKMDVVVIRPPLVYGAGVKANFAALFKVAGKGWPLPFGCFDKNRRSLVSVNNLVDFVSTCMTHPNAANQIFLVSDGDDISTRTLIENLALAQGKSLWMIPIPLSLFNLVGKLLGKGHIIDRLAGSLRVDIGKNKELLGWTPPHTMARSLELMIDDLQSIEDE
ncbi:UDP-glucose 4-epimerase family protein [Thaumasiovibrio subtropicus]|uniref:UDP-glucose 4-epimerase family protein n=1 Tax=Thaumasiovibrio subtropicus TaxID=1891207 RepID=UPI000B34F137|nr:SDR family oxidoreductase [Thaumasiovibrio subtropicus]